MRVKGQREKTVGRIVNEEDCKRACWRDMNAYVVDILGERVNRNGEMLGEFAEEMDLENLNETLAEGRVNGIVNHMWIDERGIGP